MVKTKSLYMIYKRVLSVIIALALCLAAIPLSGFAADNVSTYAPEAATEFAGGDGTQDKPYLIETAGQLKLLADNVNSGDTYSGTYFMLTDNITWESGMGSIGDYTNSKPFSGTFNGNGFKITEVNLSSTNNYQGLFIYNKGTIENLGVSGSVRGRMYVGSIVARNEGNIVNCYNLCTVTGTGSSVGGIAGQNSGGTIQNCYNTADVIVSGTSGDSNVGGIVGYSNGGTIENCYNSGDVSGYVTGIGGIVGNKSSTAVKNCYNTGTVSNGNHKVGGIAGGNEGGTLENCYNGGNVEGSTDVSGIAGYCSGDSSSIKNCYNIGAISGSSNVSGIVGEFNGGEVTSCYNYGNITGSSKGAVIGNGNKTVTDCYYLDTCGAEGSGESKTAEEFKTLVADGNLGRGNWMDHPDLERPILFSNPEITYKGNGTQGEPYTISSAADIVLLAGQANGGNSFVNTYFELTNDIDLSSVCGEGKGSWTPIGTESDSFEGIFDGGGYTISGLYINSNDQYQGLFGYVGHDNPGTVKNLNVTGNVMGDDNVGGVVGTLDQGTIENCHYSGNVSGSDFVGGIVGMIENGTIGNCSNSGDVSGTSFVGGIVGGDFHDSSEIENCYNTGNVSGTDDVGGIAGLKSDGTISNCYNIGKVSGTSNVGGILGDGVSLVQINNCYNTGKISGTSDVGSLVGVGGDANNCYYLDTSNANGTTFTNDAGTSKTEAEFNSGEVAFLLQGEQSEQVWGQKLMGEDRDAYPILSDNGNIKVLAFPLTYTDSKGEEKSVYSNSSVDAAEFPEGASVTVGDTTVTLPDGGVIDKNGNITLSDGGDIEIGDTTATIPEGGTVTPNEKGGVNVPENTEVEFSDGTEVTLPEGGVIDKDGNVTAGKIELGDTVIDFPEDTEIEADNGTVTVPDGTVVTPPSGEPEITIVDGNDKATVDEDGNITFPDGGEANIGDTTVTVPEGGTLTPNDDGTVTVPAGTVIIPDNGTDYTVGEKGGNVDSTDGSITLPEDGSIMLGDTEITTPEGGTITPNDDGTVTVPDGTVVTPPSGKPDITIVDGGNEATVDENGNVTFPNGGEAKIGDTTVTVPEGGTLSPNADGTVTVPDGTVVTPPSGKPDITIVDGGDKATVDGNGNITFPEGGEVMIDGAVVTVPKGGTIKPDENGKVFLPEGSTVTKDGKTMTVPAGGAVYDPVSGELDIDSSNNDTPNNPDTGRAIEGIAMIILAGAVGAVTVTVRKKRS